VSVTAAYNGASQLSTLNYGGYGPLVNSGYYGTSTFTETRTYNSLMQLTGLTNGLASEFYSATMVNMQYNYTAGQNNGRVAQTVDGVLGETVNYTYDVWNRLTTAAATNGNWGEQYTFDNFSNLTGKTSTAGSAPSMSVPVNPANNQPTGLGSYDANGNPVGNINSPAYVWNVENRLATNQTSPSQPITYIYDPWGRRVWTQNNYSSGSTGEIYFYGATGQKLETYSFTIADSLFNSSLLGINVYFGGKLLQSKGIWVATDKSGSVRANANPAVMNGEAMNYWPYGEERTTTANDREKFATYMRDGVGQDYAMARYYNSNIGAFWSPDPGGIKTANPWNPSSWNRYAYVLGDSINNLDPTGQIACDPDDDGDNCAADNGDCDDDGACADGGGGGGDDDGDDNDDDPCANSTATFCTTAVGQLPSAALVSAPPAVAPTIAPSSQPSPGIWPAIGEFITSVPFQVVGGFLTIFQGSTSGCDTLTCQGTMPGPPTNYKPHRGNKSPSRKPKHQEGQTRRRKSRGPSTHPTSPPRKRPPGWKGPWPPPPGTPGQ